jgi:ubiquitin-conjugating enzyme E2 J2
MNSRLLKEYNTILKSPIENIYTEPLETNILQWNFIITADIGDYSGGVYWGGLLFTKDYPMKPPQIKMFTPNGRFEINTRLCLSMSDYHPESWNPSWGVETILKGLYSYMLDDDFSDGTIGSIKDSSYNRQQYALHSLEYNNKHNVFTELYSNKPIQPVSSVENFKMECRYCFNNNDEPLITPCKCSGTNKYVHRSCLAKWQYSSILAQSTHPNYQTHIETICNVCNCEFNVREFSRENLMLQFTGKEIANMIIPGCWLISSESSSITNTNIISKNESDLELVHNLKHWTYSAFIITDVIKTTREEEHIIGINLARKLEINKCPLQYFTWLPYARLFINYRDEIEHYIGGPCNPNTPHILISCKCPHLNDIYSDNLKCLINDKQDCVLFGKLQLLNKREILWIGANCNLIKIIWGVAGWSKVQLLGETARGSWGINKANMFALIYSENTLWKKLIDNNSVLFSGKNDFSAIIS